VFIEISSVFPARVFDDRTGTLAAD